MSGTGSTRAPRPVPGAGVAIAWIPVVAWAALVWWLGGSDFGASTTSRFLEPLLRWLWPDATVSERLAVMLAVRKAAHPAVYGALAALTYRAIRLSGRARPLAAAALAFVPTCVLAALDEARQGALATRTGSPLDVALDASGAAAALALCALAARRAPALAKRSR